MVADIMTKSLPKLKHVKFTTDLGINLDDSSKNKERIDKNCIECLTFETFKSPIVELLQLLMM
jgi:hypothetical protein